MSLEEASTLVSKKKNSGHKVGYCPAWKQQYPWVVTVEQVDGSVIGLLCELCRLQNATEVEQSKPCVWTSIPCTSLRKDCIERHRQSKMHIVASLQQGSDAAMSADESQRRALIGTLKIVYWLAKEEVAIFTKYESLLCLVQSLGCTYIKDISRGGNATYSSHQIVGEFIQCLASVTADAKLSRLRSSPFYSLMIDESTDTSVLSQLVIVAKYLLPSGDVETSFVHMCDIANGKAETIEEAVMAYIQNFDLNVNKLRAFGSDGSSVMVGKNNGVAAKLKIHQPRLLSIHCINHRLALAAAHAADDIPYLQKFKSTVQSLFLFYQNSPVRMAGLH